ncbi:MAG: hypothetical protein Q7R51_02250 [bacterium]|nr:hypothetical protein [bacterium]
MKQKANFSAKEYVQKNPVKAKAIKRAIKRGIKQYEETFKRLASA